MDLSRKQISAYIGSTKRINIYAGSVRSGKSFIAMLAFLELLRSGPEGVYVICGKSERTVLHNVIEPMQALVGETIHYNRGMGEFSLLGHKVYVIGANDERAETKIRGSTFSGALVDEISILPQSFFRMLLSRLSVQGARLIGTTNPDSPSHWLKVDFLDRADELDLAHFEFTLDDNPSLTEAYVNSIKAEYRGVWHKRFILGEWVQAEGAIFDFFDAEQHIVDAAPQNAMFYLLGIDYGTTNPTAATLIGFNHAHKPNVWVQDEYYFDSKVAGYQRTDADTVYQLINYFGDYPMRAVYIDPSAASFKVELRRQNYMNWPLIDARNEVIDGIRYISSQLANNNLVICKNCVNLIREMHSYVWDDSSARLGIDKPKKVSDHAIDAMRYAIYSYWAYKTTMKEKTKEEKYFAAQEKKYAANPMAYPGFTDSHGWVNV